MHPGKIKALFIINPVLVKHSMADLSDLIISNLDPVRFHPTIIYSQYPDHPRILARQNAGEYQLIVAGGGDGTINQIACGLIHSETAMGILPMGSGNGLARSLNIPLDISNAIGIINGYKITRIDTGIAGKQRFVNIAGIGFAAEVAHAYSDSKSRGFLSYAVETIKKIPGHAPVPARIEINGRNISGEYFDISFANSSQWGYGARINPLSNLNDGLLDVCILRKFPKILFPCLLAMLFAKTIHRSKYMDIIHAEKVMIPGDGFYTGHIDGEPVEFAAPVNISIDPGSLKVICRA
jgi:YegS/Rv2252/BmrU family lipid kinase